MLLIRTFIILMMYIPIVTWEQAQLYTQTRNEKCAKIRLYTADIPFVESDLCGCVLTQFGSPCVAQRVCAIPQCVVKLTSYCISA